MSKIKFDKEQLQELTRKRTILIASELFNNSIEKIYSEADKGSSKATITLESYETYMSNPLFKETLEELSGLKVYINFNYQPKLYSGSTLVNNFSKPESCSITFDWSDD